MQNLSRLTPTTGPLESLKSGLSSETPPPSSVRTGRGSQRCFDGVPLLTGKVIARFAARGTEGHLVKVWTVVKRFGEEELRRAAECRWQKA